jgi:hypothetical protein
MCVELTKEYLEILMISSFLTSQKEGGHTVAVLPTERPVIAFEKPLIKAINPSPLNRQYIPFAKLLTE